VVADSRVGKVCEGKHMIYFIGGILLFGSVGAYILWYGRKLRQWEEANRAWDNFCDVHRIPKERRAYFSAPHWPGRIRGSGSGADMRQLNFIGLLLGMIGVVCIFVWGPPQPSFQEYVAVAVDQSAAISRENAARVASEKDLYSVMSRIGLGFIFAGFALQAVAAWPRRTRPPDSSIAAGDT
jgi:hypothetical protein